MKVVGIRQRYQMGVLALLGALCLALGSIADVDRINGMLRRAEVNLSSVTQSIGDRTSWPGGSSGKLLSRRLDQVKGDLDPAKELLDTIPAGTEGRDEAAARYETMAAEYNRLITIANGGTAPAPEAAEGTKLDYRQEEVLSGAQFNLRQVEADATSLVQRTGELRAIEDQLTVSYREVASLRETLANARRKSGFVGDGLDKLPEDGRGVPETRERNAAADANLDAAAGYLDPLHATLQNLINPANYPDFDTDQRRVRELSVMFGNTDILITNRPLAADTFAQAGAAREECVRVVRKYARLIQQETGQGQLLAGTANGFFRSHAEYLAAGESAKGSLPAEIRKDLTEATTLANDAVAQQKPLWFTGGMSQIMGFAQDRQLLLEALDPAAGAQLQTEIDAAQQTINQQAAQLRELIIRENRPPADRFEGPDRDKAIKVAKSGWKVQQDEYDLLAVKIPSEAWSRETKWTYSNGTWYFSDRSKLQVRLIVADHEDPTLAIDRPVTVIKDHQKGDSMIGVPLWSFDDELQPGSYMLRSNVK